MYIFNLNYMFFFIYFPFRYGTPKILDAFINNKNSNSIIYVKQIVARFITADVHQLYIHNQ